MTEKTKAIAEDLRKVGTALTIAGAAALVLKPETVDSFNALIALMLGILSWVGGLVLTKGTNKREGER